MFVQDFVQNGQGYGDVAGALAGCRFDPGMMRPYFDEKGQRCVTVNTGRKVKDKTTGEYVPEYKKALISQLASNGMGTPVWNATSLRKDEWIQMDRQILKEARQRLRAWTDLAAASSFGGFNGMAKTVLEAEAMSDPGEAMVDMDGLSEGRSDSPLFKNRGLPLPITHSSFWFSQRNLAVSRNSGTPLDLTMAEAAGRRVAEMVEKTLIGAETGLSFGKAANYSDYEIPTVYGYTNFPQRNSKEDLTVPTGSNPSSTVADVLEMRQLLYDDHFYGPYMLYHSDDWDTYMDNDYFALATSGMAAPTQTLRERLRKIEGIQDVRRLDFLTDTFTLLLVQMTSDVARAVNGMDITTVQWETRGGMQLNFKVMAIMVPQLRADYSGRCGIVHATTVAQS